MSRRRFMQGDVYLMEERLPADLEPEGGGRWITLPHGAALGNIHAKAFRSKDGDLFVVVQGGLATMRGPNLGTISIPPGTYRVIDVESEEISGW